MEKRGCRRAKALISPKRGKIGPRLLITIENHSIALSIGAKIKFNDHG